MLIKSCIPNCFNSLEIMISLTLVVPTRCRLIQQHRIFCWGRLPSFSLQVDTRRVLVGRGHHDHCGIRRYVVSINNSTYTPSRLINDHINDGTYMRVFNSCQNVIGAALHSVHILTSGVCLGFKNHHSHNLLLCCLLYIYLLLLAKHLGHYFLFHYILVLSFFVFLLFLCWSIINYEDEH